MEEEVDILEEGGGGEPEAAHGFAAFIAPLGGVPCHLDAVKKKVWSIMGVEAM